jgi:methylated-DNA-protein-cysteine methyltransferase related protein
MNVATSDHSQARTPGQARPDTATSTGGGFGGSPPRGITWASPPEESTDERGNVRPLPPQNPGQARDHSVTSTGGGFGGSPPRVFEDAVIEAVRSIPMGEVMTYGEAAEVAGFPGRARGVGRILAISAEDMPWWRVVGAGLRIVSPSADEQSRLLRQEGWIVNGSRVTDGTRTDRARPAN